MLNTIFISSHCCREFSDAVGHALAEAGLYVDLAAIGYSELNYTLGSMSRDGIRYACVVEEQRTPRADLSVVFLATPNFESMTFPPLY